MQRKGFGIHLYFDPNQELILFCPLPKLYNMFNNKTCCSQHNFSTPCSSDDCNRENHVCFRDAVTLSTSVIIAVLSPVAVVGNALILATIWKRTFVRTSFHILLSGLALTDLFTGLVAQPFYAAAFIANSMAAHDTPMLVTTILTIGESTSTFFISITILTITVMSIERWLYMARRSFITPRRRYFTVILLLLLPIPAVVVRVLANHKDPAYYFIYTITTITQLSCCYVITSISYFKVYRIIRCHQHRIQASGVSQNSDPESAIDLSKYKKSVGTMLYILLIFCLCFVPYIVATPLKFTPASKNLEAFVAERVSVVLIYLSSSLNPGLYLWRMRDIRNGLKQLLGRTS